VHYPGKRLMAEVLCAMILKWQRLSGAIEITTRCTPLPASTVRITVVTDVSVAGRGRGSEVF